MAKKVVVCAELGAFSLKDPIVEHLKKCGCEVDDISLREDSSDRPYYEIGEVVGKAIAAKKYDLGFVFCGSGMGVAMAANRIEGVYCACCETVHSAVMARGINNANVLALGVMITGPVLGCMMAEAFVNSEFPDSAPAHISREGLKQCLEELKKVDYAAHHQST